MTASMALDLFSDLAGCAAEETTRRAAAEVAAGADLKSGCRHLFHLQIASRQSCAPIWRAPNLQRSL